MLRVGASEASLQGAVTNYSNPIANGTYAIRIHTQDFASMSPSAKAEGDVLLSGKLHYQAVANEPAIRNVSIDGRIASDLLRAAASGRRVELRNLQGEYRLANGNLVLRNVAVETLDGRIVADGEMNRLDSTPDSRFHASLQGISLREVQRTAGTQLSAAAISGQIGGTAEAAWKGSIQNIRARSDLSLRAEASSTANPKAEQVPVTGNVHASYDGRRQTIHLQDTVIKVPTATVTAQGTISDRSSLQVQLVANDLHQLELLAASFLAGGNPPPAVSGKATVNAVVQGSLKKPSISAQLNAQDLRVQGSEWKSASLGLRANPSELNVDNGKLVNAQQGQATFSATVELHNWVYQPSDRIQARLNAQQFRIADLQQVANQHYPVSGVLNAKIAVN
ncbi:MAG TPA: hypothetical protein VMP68_18940, partial [Candidatus Eisenbacteria bacterium]|nr:hypothetical protein [Candidatus Eisenbacteria bacterium]